MAGKTVNPTRMELTRLKGRLKTARRGHKLLKDKRDELMKQFMDVVRRNRALRAKVEQGLKEANAAFTVAAALMGPEVLDVLRELSEVATLAVVTNGFQNVQIRRLAESGVLNFMEDVFVSEKMDSEKPNRRIFDAALRALGVENREHVLVVGDGLSSDIQGGVNAGLDTCWYNPSHAENPGKVVPTYEIADLKELYPLVMEQEELANVGLKNRRHQC